MWIGERDIEGGPVGWYSNHFGDPVNTFASVAYIMATLLQDGMLVSFFFLYIFAWVVQFWAYCSFTDYWSCGAFGIQSR